MFVQLGPGDDFFQSVCSTHLIMWNAGIIFLRLLLTGIGNTFTLFKSANFSHRHIIYEECIQTREGFIAPWLSGDEGYRMILFTSAMWLKLSLPSQLLQWLPCLHLLEHVLSWKTAKSYRKCQRLKRKHCLLARVYLMPSSAVAIACYCGKWHFRRRESHCSTSRLKCPQGGARNDSSSTSRMHHHRQLPVAQ